MNSTSSSAATLGAVRRKRFWGALAAPAMLSAVMVAVATPSGAATQSTTLNAACTGVGEEDKALLGAVGASVLEVPLTSTVEAPAFVEPEQTGVPVSINWKIDLPASFADTAVGAGISELTIQNARVDVVVNGPTDTERIPGRPAPQTVTLAAGTPISSGFGPFNGTLDNIGTGGLIRLRSEVFTFDVSLSIAGAATEVAITCATAATLASIPIKVAGSPDIVQPIAVESAPGQPSTVDVLGQFVTNGFTKDGVEQQVDPSTLRIVEGDATVQGGQIVATGPAAGTSTDVTFEVCAGTIEVAAAEAGITDVQEIRFFFDPPNQAGRRQMGVRMALEGEQSNPIWSLALGPLAPPQPPADESKPEEAGDAWQSWWQLNANQYFFVPHEYPTADEVRVGLESIPGIGAGNVEVTAGDVVSNSAGNVPEGDTLKGGLQYKPYTVEFTGELAEKAVSQLTVARLYSFLPIEIRDSLLAVAGSIGGGEGEGGEGEGGEEPEKTPIPPQYDESETPVQDYVNDLNFRAGTQAQNGDIIGYVETVDLLLTVLGENVGELIDVGEVTALLADIFAPQPEVVTVVNGADPVEAKTQELCSQGIVTLSSQGVVVAGETEANAGGAATENQGGASVSVAG